MKSEEMISYSEAVNIINSYKNLINPEKDDLSIHECLGKTLAEDIIADTDFPSFAHSSMDGYAVKFAEGRWSWEVTGEISAGNFDSSIETGAQAVKIMTGGKMPPDADTVIPIEYVENNGNLIQLKEDFVLKVGKNIRYKGEFLKKGMTALSKHTFLKPNHLTLAASCGYSKLKVLKPLKIAVLSTGDELIDFTETPSDDKLRATNSFSIGMLLKEYGMEPEIIENARDEKQDIRNKVIAALNTNCDILVTSGGVSVGEHDYVQDVLREIGAEIIFWKVNIKPGKPFLFSIIKHKNKSVPIFSFPGNPVSAFVNYHIFLKPFLNLFFKHDENVFECTLTEKLTKKDSKLHFVTSEYFYQTDSKEIFVKPSRNISSGNLISLAQSNCLIMFDEDKRLIEAGERVKCLRI